MCRDAVTSVDYTILWESAPDAESEITISRFLISVTVDDLEATAAGLGHTQEFAVNFIGTSNRTESIRAATQWWKAGVDSTNTGYTAEAPALRTFQKRMGNPGYVVGVPLVGYSPEAAEIGVTSFAREAGSASTGMCNEPFSIDSSQKGNASSAVRELPLARSPVRFGMSSIDGCQFGIHQSEFTNCAALRERAQGSLAHGFGLDTLRYLPAYADLPEEYGLDGDGTSVSLPQIPPSLALSLFLSFSLVLSIFLVHASVHVPQARVFVSGGKMR